MRLQVLLAFSLVLMQSPEIGYSQVATAQNDNKASEQVELALGILIKDGAAAGAQALVKGGTLESNNENLKLEGQFRQIEAQYGKAEGYEIISRRRISSRTLVTIFAIHYQKGAIFGRMQTYKTAGEAWIPVGYQFHADASLMFPGSMQVVP